MQERKNEKVPVTITMASIVKKIGMQRAEILGQNFSDYISELIRRDNAKLIDSYVKHEQSSRPLQSNRRSPKKKEKTFNDYINESDSSTTSTPIKLISKMLSHTGDTVTPQELATAIGVSDRYIQRMLKEDKIRGFKDKRSWKIPVEEVDRLKAERSERDK